MGTIDTCAICKVNMDPRGKRAYKDPSQPRFCGKCRKTHKTFVNKTEAPYVPYSRRSVENKQKTAVINKKCRLQKEYGLSLEDYERMSREQQGRCAVCFKEPYRLVVDHCHVTGRVRALLCDNCNFALGHVKDDPMKLESLKQYILKFSEKEEFK